MIFFFCKRASFFNALLHLVGYVIWQTISVKPAKWHLTQVCQLSPTGQALQPVFTLCCCFLKEQSLPLAMIHSVSGAFWTIKSKKFFTNLWMIVFWLCFTATCPSVCSFFCFSSGPEDPPVQPAEGGNGAEDAAHKSPSAGQMSTCFTCLTHHISTRPTIHSEGPRHSTLIKIICR